MSERKEELKERNGSPIRFPALTMFLDSAMSEERYGAAVFLWRSSRCLILTNPAGFLFGTVPRSERGAKPDEFGWYCL